MDSTQAGTEDQIPVDDGDLDLDLELDGDMSVPSPSLISSVAAGQMFRFDSNNDSLNVQSNNIANEDTRDAEDIPPPRRARPVRASGNAGQANQANVNNGGMSERNRLLADVKKPLITYRQLKGQLVPTRNGEPFLVLA